MNLNRIAVSLCLIVVILGGASLGFYLLDKFKDQPEQRDSLDEGVLVRVQEIHPETLNMNVEGFGTVHPKTDLLLVAQVSGRVETLSPKLRVGSMIRKGDLLLRIDPRSYRLDIVRGEALVEQNRAQITSLQQEKKNLEANLALAQKELEPAKRELDRAESLLKSRSGSEQARDIAETTWLGVRIRLQNIENQLLLWPQRQAVAEANLKQVQAQLDEAKLSLEYTEIHAPFDGRVSQRLVEAGQFVAPGTSLARIYDSDLMEIPIRLSLPDFDWIDTACYFQKDASDIPQASKPSAKVRLKVGEHTCVWTGVVSRVDGQIERATRTAGLIIETSAESLVCDAASSPSSPGHDPNFEREVHHAQLLPGLFVDVEIEGRSVAEVFRVPRGVLDQDARLYLAVDGKLVTREVRMLRAINGVATITGDLSDGDQVIVSHPPIPVEGMKIRIEEEVK